MQGKFSIYIPHLANFRLAGFLAYKHKCATSAVFWLKTERHFQIFFYLCFLINKIYKDLKKKIKYRSKSRIGQGWILEESQISTQTSKKKILINVWIGFPLTDLLAVYQLFQPRLVFELNSIIWKIDVLLFIDLYVLFRQYGLPRARPLRWKWWIV